MWSEDKLNELLTNPSDKLVEDVKKLKGDIMILGAGTVAKIADMLFST